MTKSDLHLLFILAAYAVPVVLLTLEVWQLARRARKLRKAADEA